MAVALGALENGRPVIEVLLRLSISVQYPLLLLPSARAP